jgi:hypothetical protein
MMSSLTTMLTCRWSARRIQRYLDSDPAALLEAAQVHRLQEHLAMCERCASAAEDYRGMRRALGAWSQRHGPDATMIARVRLAAELVMVEDLG